MKRLSIVFIVLLFTFNVCSANDFVQVLDEFNQAPAVATANRVFDFLLQEEFIDEPMVMPQNASHDTLCAAVWYWAAEWYYDTQDYAEAEQFGLQSLPLCKAVGDKTMEADCASLLGLIYVRLGDFNNAAIYAKRCNELDRESGDNNNIASSYNTLAGIYMSMRQVDEAEKYILKAIEYVEKTDNLPRKAVIYGMASEVYQHKYGDQDRLKNGGDKKMLEQTLNYATRAWEIEKQLQRPVHAAIRQTQRAAALTVLERYNESEECLLDAIPVLEESGNLHSLGIAYNHLGDLYYITGRNQEGADVYYKALDIFVEQHDIYNEAHTRKGLRETLRGIDPEKALEHGDRFEHLRDSIYDHETNQNLSEYAALYGNDILQQLNHKQRVRYVWLIVMILLCIVCLAVGTYVIYRRSQKRQVQHFNDLLIEVEKLRAQIRARKQVETLSGSGLSVQDKSEEERNAEADDNLFLARVMESVTNGMKNGQYSVENVADSMNMSISTFRRRMISITGDSPKNFILAIQMEKAAQMLVQEPQSTVAEIAIRIGFSEAGSFARTFHRFYGITPTQYREQNMKQQNA